MEIKESGEGILYCFLPLSFYKTRILSMLIDWKGKENEERQGMEGVAKITGKKEKM